MDLDRGPKSIATPLVAAAGLVLADVSSTYFNHHHCPLAAHRHSRDSKNGNLQIVFGLLCNGSSCPVVVQVFAGNTADPRTVLGVSCCLGTALSGASKNDPIGNRLLNLG